MKRLAHLAPEEIAGAILLAVVLAFVALQPATVFDRLTGWPYATPIPGGGPGLRFLEDEPSPSPTPASFFIFGTDSLRMAARPTAVAR